MCRQTVAGASAFPFSLRRAERKQLHRQRHGQRQSGQPGSASHNLAVDTTAPVLTINTVVGDDIINDAEHAQALVISGTSTGGKRAMW
ncbi:hypothetical protein FA039_04925 [Escherichia coli]|nr:hypothetical protein [Escherichia coli]